MSHSDGFESRSESSRIEVTAPSVTAESMLLESLVHHLIEKGLLTKNDALSVVQAVAQVKRGQLHEGTLDNARTEAELAMLQRLYESFEAVHERSARVRPDGENVRQLRPPLHADSPEFPRDD